MASLLDNHVQSQCNIGFGLLFVGNLPSTFLMSPTRFFKYVSNQYMPKITKTVSNQREILIVFFMK